MGAFAYYWLDFWKNTYLLIIWTGEDLIALAFIFAKTYLFLRCQTKIPVLSRIFNNSLQESVQQPQLVYYPGQLQILFTFFL